MTEVWLPFPKHPTHKVSNLGRILNTKTNHELRPTIDSNGYMRVSMYEDGKIVPYYVHRIVAELFVPAWRSTTMLSFRNGNKQDCSLDNLMVRQTLKGVNLGTPRPAVQASRVKIVELDEIFRNAIEAAARIQGDPSMIYKCLRYERGSHRGYTFKSVSVAEALEYRRNADNNGA